MYYTIGQRQGLGIGGRESGHDDPWYVVDKDIKNNALIVAQGNQHPRLYSQGLLCGPIHWLSDSRDNMPLTCYAKTRYRQLEQACVIAAEDKGEHCVLFSNPQRAVTPGQYIVFYDQNRCLGGATIEQIIR
jgi:tRNA-specific 2-thiouridylase